MNKENSQKQLDEYRNELKTTVENHERIMQMLNQQAVKIEQLRGAIAAIERLLKEDENVGNENGTNPQG